MRSARQLQACARRMDSVPWVPQDILSQSPHAEAGRASPCGVWHSVLGALHPPESARVAPEDGKGRVHGQDPLGGSLGSRQREKGAVHGEATPSIASQGCIPAPETTMKLGRRLHSFLFL